MNPVITRSAVALAAAVAGLSALPPPDQDKRLSSYQQRCSQALSFFVTQIPSIDNGRHQVTFGEAHRPSWVATEYAKRGLGISTSLHIDRLAIDLNLFVDGNFQATTEAHKPLALLWMEIGPMFGVVPAAGYYFNDGNHYSCAWQGRK
jgi:hypothetical protein